MRTIKINIKFFFFAEKSSIFRFFPRKKPKKSILTILIRSKVQLSILSILIAHPKSQKVNISTFLIYCFYFFQKSVFLGHFMFFFAQREVDQFMICFNCIFLILFFFLFLLSSTCCVVLVTATMYFFCSGRGR